MQLYGISCVLFAIVALATSWISAGLLGAGLWAVLMVLAALVVAASPFYEPMQPVARVIAGLAAVLSGMAVALGLAAATIGGTFNMPVSRAPCLPGWDSWALLAWW
jgi:hypothetical protein